YNFYKLELFHARDCKGIEICLSNRFTRKADTVIPMKKNETQGDILRALMDRDGIKGPSELARLVGCTPQTIGYELKGETESLSAKYLLEVARIFRVPVESLRPGSKHRLPFSLTQMRDGVSLSRKPVLIVASATPDAEGRATLTAMTERMTVQHPVQ